MEKENINASANEVNTPEQANSEWYSAYPTEIQDKLKDFTKAEDFQTALERGSIAPLAKSEDFSFDFPEDALVDNTVFDGFRQKAVELGLNAEQAKNLVSWQLDLAKQVSEQTFNEGQAKLKTAWGAELEKNSQAALNFFTTLDRKMGGAFSSSSAGQSFANDPVAIQAFYELSKMIGEDSIGASSGASPAPLATRKDFYNNLFQGK